MFYYALTFLPIGFLIGLFSKKDKPVLDAFIISVLVSFLFVIIIQFNIIKLNINLYDMFIFNVVGCVVGAYIFTLIKYIKNKKAKKENNSK